MDKLMFCRSSTFEYQMRWWTSSKTSRQPSRHHAVEEEEWAEGVSTAVVVEREGAVWVEVGAAEDGDGGVEVTRRQ